MKRITTKFAIVSVLLAGLSFVSAIEAKVAVKPKMLSAQTAIVQTRCPVMDAKINPKLFTIYKGKKVYFCCKGCKAVFEKNPEKYLKKLPQFASTQPAAKQVVCPVSGKPVQSKIFTTYKGKKVYFCCKGCKKAFEKNPKKYLKKLPQFASTQPIKKQMVCPMSGKPVNPKIFTVYKGRKIYFCGQGCKKAFEKNPGKYIGKVTRRSAPCCTTRPASMPPCCPGCRMK